MYIMRRCLIKHIIALLFFLGIFFSVSSNAKNLQVPGDELFLDAGKWYHISGTVQISDEEIKNQNPLLCIKFFFKNEFIFCNAEGTYLIPAADGKSVYKYIFVDDLVKKENGLFEYHFQFKTPDDLKKTYIQTLAWKNKYPVSIGKLTVNINPVAAVYLSKEPMIRKLRLNQYTTLVRISGNVKVRGKKVQIPDRKLVATVKLSDYRKHNLTPGLNLAYSCDLKENFIYLKPDSDGNFVHEIRIPHNSAELEIGIRTFFYQETVELSDLKLEQTFLPQPLRKTDIVFERDISGGNIATIEGYLSDDSKPIQNKSAYIRIYVMDQFGKIISVSGLPQNREKNYYYVYLPQKAGQNFFSVSFNLPQNAKKMRVVVSRFFNDKKLTLHYFNIQEKTKSLKHRFREAGIRLTPDFMENEAVLDQILDYLIPGVKIDELATSVIFPDLPVPVGHGYIFNPAGKNEPGWMSVKSFKPYKLPSELKWNENPYLHSTWQQKYYSLYWAIIGDQSRSDAEYIKTVLRSFFSCTPYPFHLNPMCYEDHTVSCRLEGMLALFHGVKKNQNIFDFVTFSGIRSKRDELIADSLFTKQYFVQMLIDAEYLYEFLQNKTLGVHNHNLFMARALLCLSLAFPKLPKADSYYRTAIDTIISHLSMMYEVDHVTAEQAANYQHTFLMYFLELYCWIRSIKSFDQEIEKYICRRVKNILLADLDMIDPGGGFFAMGDSVWSSDRIYKEFRTLLGIFSEKTNRKGLLKHSVKDASVYRESGIYVFRNPRKNRALFIDISANQKVHGHYDQGNFILYAGRPLIIDGGGPYRYGSKIYRQLMSSDSHNISAPEGVRQMAGEVGQVVYEEQAETYYLAFRSNVYGPDYIYLREFIIRKDLSSIKIRDLFLNHSRKKEVPVCRSQLIFPAEVCSELTEKDGEWCITSEKYPENQFRVNFSGNSGLATLRDFLMTVEINQLQKTKSLSIPFLIGQPLVTEINLGKK